MQVSGKENILTNRHQSTDELLFIPVIIHVVYHENAEDLSIEQINSQISVLNKDFRANNVDLINLEELFEGFEADVNLEFFLADTLLNTGYYGIHKISTEQSVSTPDNLFSSDSGGADPIDPDKFLNIWVANLSEGLLGFNGVEGIAVDYTHFGTMGTVSDPYDLGRTLTHELGHYFSLDHLWGTGGCESDDGIEDTPNQASSVNSCDQEIISCGSTDMVQNFMNLSTDECLLFFTEGQKSKMRKYLYEQKPN
ncbi:MAG: hypothetical protein GY816_13825 [Cytophagales bacterium]|nr:hypothetical protein [Cytophagales bacterium]